KTPGEDGFWFPQDPCQRPITFHHLISSDFQRLHDVSVKVAAESIETYGNKSKHFELTYGDVFQEYYKDTDLYSHLYEGFDRPGNDYKHFESINKEECASMCERETRCYSWVFDGKKCWLKDTIGHDKTQAKGFYSGVFPEKYVCDWDV
ncbi:hypothetical protein HK099_000901, partial [Clydaea vesicula]